jgi:fructose-1,6-bisphosphatase/inositol monophosphatase family enzyme
LPAEAADPDRDSRVESERISSCGHAGLCGRTFVTDDSIGSIFQTIPSGFMIGILIVWTISLIEVEDVRRMGSAEIDLTYVAYGRSSAYFEAGLKPWDVAAAVLMARETGGKFADFKGRLAGPTDNRGLPPRQIFVGNLKIADTLRNRIVNTGHAAALDS